MRYLPSTRVLYRSTCDEAHAAGIESILLGDRCRDGVVLKLAR